MAYNYFGQQPAPPSATTPQMLAQAMQLPEFTNQTSSNAQPSQGGGMPSISPQMLANMMQSQDQGSVKYNDTGVPIEAQAQGVPSNATSYSLSGNPLPWLQQPLPWLNGGGNG